MNAVSSDISHHNPVLVNSFIKLVSPVNGTWVDCTFGAGGYSLALLEAGAKRVIGIDRDPDTAYHAIGVKKKFGNKFALKKANFSELKVVVQELSKNKISGIVFDVGVSSMQIDQADRGFSFQRDGPLDMRMSREGISAFDIVNGADEKDLADILYYYGEEQAARRIARLIVADRSRHPISTTHQLSNLVSRATKKTSRGNRKLINPATRTFQALRIAVNNELVELHSGLIAAEQILPIGGFLAVVSFHSLEDRLIKNFIRARSRLGAAQSRFLPENKELPPTFREISKKVIKPDKIEIIENSRARSAKLRVSEKISEKCFSSEHLNSFFPQVKFNIGEC